MESTTQELPSPAKQAEDEAREAQVKALEHSEALKSIATPVAKNLEDGSETPQRSPADEAVLREWAAEGGNMRRDAFEKAQEASLKNPVKTGPTDYRGVALTERTDLPAYQPTAPATGGRLGD